MPTRLKPVSIELLENRTLLTGPGFVSVSPNIGQFIQDGDQRTEVPEEFIFQFSPGQAIDTSTLGAIQVHAAGHDGQFRPASTITDFGTGGQAVLRLGTQRLGTDENGASLTIQAADNSGNGPTVAVIPAANEIQQIDIGSQITGGTFLLRFSGSNTAAIPFDATAAVVRTALEGLTSINPGDVIVTGGQLPGTPISVEFAGQYAKTDVPQMVLFGNGLTNNEQQSVSLTGNPTGGSFSLSLTDAGAGISGTSNAIDFDALVQNERQFVSTTGSPTGGTFTLNFNDAGGSGISGTSGNIGFNASAAAVQTAIEAGIPALIGNILVTGGALPTEVRIEFIGALAGQNVASFTLAANALTGGTTPSAVVRTSESVRGALEAGIPALAGNILVTAGPLPGSVTIEFTGTLADRNIATFTQATNNLTGGTAPATAIVTVANGNQSANGITTLRTGGADQITLTLDSNAASPTTAGSLLSYLATDAVASQLLTGELLEGLASTDISGTPGETRILDGAGAASVVTDLGTGTDLRVEITADAAGPDGNLISVQLNRQDRGAVSATPQVTVTGNRIQVVLNDNPGAQTTAQNLVTALNANAGALINATIELGSGLEIASGVQDGTLLQLSGADDVVAAGFRGIGDSSNEVLFRFAEPMSDDLYRIQVVGAGSSPLLNSFGEKFKDGVDEIRDLTLNLGGQVTAVVPQPVLRDQVVTVGAIANVRDGDTITVDPGTSPVSFATAANNFGTAGVAEVTFNAVSAGSAGNGVTVVVTKFDQGMAGAPTVSVAGQTVSVILNSNAGNQSSAQGLIDAIAANPDAAALVTASFTGSGSGAEVITGPVSTTVTLRGAVDLFTFELNDTSVEAAGTVRTGNIAIDYDSGTATPNSLASLIESAINMTTMSDPDVTAVRTDNRVTVTGGAFDVRLTLTQQSTGLSSRAGGLSQRRDIVNVYFTDDELNSALVENPVFYRLFDTNGTFARDDGEVQIPDSVVYDSVNNTATLVFAADLADATYRLRLGESEEANNTDVTAVEVGTVFDVTEFVVTALVGDDNAQGLADVDLYEVNIVAGGTITVGVTANGGLDAIIRLLDDTGTEVDSDDGTVSGSFTDSFSFTSAGGGTFYIGVSAVGNASYDIDGTGAVDRATTGPYTLNVTSDSTVPASDLNSSFATATGVGILAGGTQLISSQIEPQLVALPPSAGGTDEPGHREIPAESHGVGPGTDLVTPSSVGVVTFSFPTIYGTDSQGNTLFNQITEDQKTRAREIFEIYSDVYGFEVAEVTSGGIRVVTGDPRAVSPTVPVSAVGGIAGGGLVVMNSFVGGGFTAQESQFGGSWMGIAMHEIGHAVGLGHSYDVHSVQGNGTLGEDQFPGNNDIVHGRRIHPNTANDIDVYRFQVEETGTFSAETIAERRTASSLLNTAMKLYREDAMTGERILIAQNDDYFSNDSFIELELDPGTYFVSVSSTGNTDYDPTVSDTGFGGTSDGVYDLRLKFSASARSTLTDMTGTAFDGDNDSEAGGAHEFYFRSADTVFVDKTVITNLAAPVNATQLTITVDDNTVFNSTGSFDILVDNERMTVTAVGMTGTSLTVTRGVGGTVAASHADNRAVRPFLADGSEANPFGLVSSAVAASSPGDIIRIVGNGGADNDVLTLGDNRSYLFGQDDSARALEDGSKFEIPKNVTVQIDAGTVVKLDGTNIDVGTSAVGIDRSGGSLQVLGTPGTEVQFTSYKDDSIGGDSNAAGSPAQAEDWGGLVFRSDSDFQDVGAAPADPGIFLNYVNQAAIQYGGGRVVVDSVEQSFSAIHLVTSRPTITNNDLSNNAAAAMSANPNSFDDSRGRIGPDLHGNILVDNTFNGIFVRILTPFGQGIDRLSRTARFDDTDIVHVITENLEIVGNPGGPLDGVARPSGRLAIDPGVTVKLGAARIEALRGNAHIIAEGTEENPIIITSIQDDRYGAGGTFDTTNNQSTRSPAGGDWGGLIFNATSRGSIDNAYIAFGGGQTPIAGSIDSFNTIEIHHQADVRIANSTFETNEAGNGGSRNGRGATDTATIFVRQAQPIIVNNTFRDNEGSIIHINANAMLAEFQRDTGRSTGSIGDFPQFADNRGPLVRLNRTDNNEINGLEIRGDVLTTESVWDDTDIVHVLRDEIIVNQHHTFSGLRLQSNPGE
ncbi:MAG: pre-peptidase C-terminal domain-containing protein, partial [Planctomycetota bacterium]|nr:pre-peptidase C-terminal domain-containing protein [Planctomycetota bacterium]